MKVKRFIKEFKPIEIKEPFKTDVIEFPNPIEFTKYYREHEDEFANMSTYKLNIRYKIPGYKISQPKPRENTQNPPEIKLIKDYRGVNSQPKGIFGSRTEDSEISIELKERIELLEKRIANIESYLSSVQQE